jgi:hypothetical protein
MQRFVLASVLALCLAPPAHAEIPPIVEFGESWFFDAASGPSPNPPFPSEPTIVGRVERFGGALAPLNDLMPGVEFTFVQRELVFLTADQAGIPGVPGTAHQVYGGGRLEIHADHTPDASFAAPTSFGDGDAVLVARCEQLSFVYSSGARHSFESPIVMSAGLVLTGGTEMGRLAETPGAFRMRQVARVVMERSALDPERTALGYSGRLEGAIELRPETAVAPTTWSRIKSLVSAAP